MSHRMDRLQFYLEPELNKALDGLSDKLRISKAELIRRGVRNLLEQMVTVPDPAREIIGMLSTPNAGPPTNWAVRHDELIYRRDWEG